ncbi:dipeptidyl-peptidase 3 family protein [Prevotella amnii]|uniref:Dihydrofolate reductase n=1 Tax=Prevotella amnii DNF00058 TaxID=1401066 RepID=A0A096AXB0_9BACT|nr:dihydrofolate reductase [Prevotella amnii]KGF51445.1 dihydrofolate reductase [Prevotella amnii DNF00058]
MENNKIKSEYNFNYIDEQFADIQILRYKLTGFDKLSLSQKQYIYCLSQATLYGRDILFDQFGKYNLRIRKTLEAILLYYKGARDEAFFNIIEYLKKVWFANGIYHHYGSDKFEPNFSEEYFRKIIISLPKEVLPCYNNESVNELLEKIIPIIFDPKILPKRVNKKDGCDLIKSSACNYYEGVSQKEVEFFYAEKKAKGSKERPISYGLNSSLCKINGKIVEDVWHINGKYSKALEKIVYWLHESLKFTENEQQKKVINLLIKYYQTGDLYIFDKYSIEWLKEKEGQIDFINGFIEVYSDPLGLKASWEGIVEYKDLEATKRANIISTNAQWFEDNSPIDPRFRKETVKGVTANVVNAAMLGGDEYPSTAIGINLPNADWIRSEYGSKSVTIGNLTHAYNIASKGNGFYEEFVIDKETYELINMFGSKTDDLHTDLHECLGHGSGKLLLSTDPDSLKNYGNTIEEARADLFGLYYIADKKLLELGLLDNKDAYKAHYYSYLMNGLLTQQVRIKPGKKIEEAHMQNRALIAWWAMDLGKEEEVIEFISKNSKTYIRINNYTTLRSIFAKQLAEIQRIKSEGDFNAARALVEKYAINLNKKQHEEVLKRYKQLNIAPYKGFINPVLKPILNKNNTIIDIIADYSETYSEQMLRYSKEYSTL